MKQHEHELAENGMEKVQKLNNLYGQFYKGMVLKSMNYGARKKFRPFFARTAIR